MTNTESERGPTGPEQRIVVGYMHIDDCEVALDRAIEVSRAQLDSVVHVVRAIPLPEHAEIDALDDAFEHAREETVEAILRACERMGSPPSPIHIDVSFGDPAETIAAAAKRVAATLVVIGHGCEGRVARALSEGLRCTLLVATSDRYSGPESPPAPEIAAPDDPAREPHVYKHENVFEHCTYHIGPTRIY